MSTAILHPHPDLFESGSTGNGFDTESITSDMVLTIFRVAAGTPVCGLDQVIQHADVDEGPDYVNHPASPSDFFGDNSAVVLLQRVVTKRFVRIFTQATPPTDDPLFVSGAVLNW